MDKEFSLFSIFWFFECKDVWGNIFIYLNLSYFLMFCSITAKLFPINSINVVMGF